eukprot:CAMPEP_0116978786 /NCGR_PEP_ID=MMETSP0467-20121206/58014_1 /TAXON_ID=283647 /ORGANISM="Mesodinium pulex, Strain SPMC105" /LENGTH=57 /DNA_ID=CAMNT_0004672273 /DNA_START=1124 /DNA_END=1297 /DNA_ORIENTATION=-
MIDPNLHILDSSNVRKIGMKDWGYLIEDNENQEQRDIVLTKRVSYNWSYGVTGTTFN